MNKININVSEYERYPDYSMERVYGSSGEYHIGFFLYLMLRLAEKISEWRDGKFFDLVYTEPYIADQQAVWDDRFGEAENVSLELAEFRAMAEEGMERSSIPFDEAEFSREFQAMKRMEKK